jgi:hypothetical protein
MCCGGRRETGPDFRRRLSPFDLIDHGVAQFNKLPTDFPAESITCKPTPSFPHPTHGIPQAEDQTMPSANPAPEKNLPRKKISEKQLAANRANSLRSTGPRTDSGKAAISQNALRHGLTAQVAVLPSEDRAAHETFCQALIADFAPDTDLELNIAQSIADDMWRLNRARAVENNIFAVCLSEADPDPDPDHDPAMQIALNGARTFMDHAGKFGLLSLYEQRIHRTMHKNLVPLRQMQAERKEFQQQELERACKAHAAPAAQPIAINDFTPRKQRNGFDFANDISEVETPVERHKPIVRLARAA